MDPNTLLNFLDLAEKLKCNTRHSFTSSGRHESVAEHSWRLTLMAYLIGDELPGVDINKVIRMCLIHDLGEAVTGDIPSFLKTQQDEAVESDAQSQLLRLLPQPLAGEMADLFAEMDALETPEAKTFKALDKLEAIIQHNEADLSTWLPLEYDLQMTYGIENCACSPFLAALRQAVLDQTCRKINQAPAQAPADPA